MENDVMTCAQSNRKQIKDNALRRFERFFFSCYIKVSVQGRKIAILHSTYKINTLKQA